jgi:hypothetical protein
VDVFDLVGRLRKKVVHHVDVKNRSIEVGASAGAVEDAVEATRIMGWDHICVACREAFVVGVITTGHIKVATEDVWWQGSEVGEEIGKRVSLRLVT